MIEYAKTILPKVVAYKELFRKELLKCINWAEKDERKELYRWCYLNFFDTYPDILTEAGSIIKSTNKIGDGRNEIFSTGFYKQPQLQKQEEKKIS